MRAVIVVVMIAQNRVLSDPRLKFGQSLHTMRHAIITFNDIAGIKKKVRLKNGKFVKKPPQGVQMQGEMTVRNMQEGHRPL